MVAVEETPFNSNPILLNGYYKFKNYERCLFKKHI